MTTTFDPTRTLVEMRQKIEVLSSRRVPSLAKEIMTDFVTLDGWMAEGNAPPDQWATRSLGRPRLGDGVILDGVNHGTRQAYGKKCKCTACRAANRLRRDLTDIEMEEY